jgi:PelA/Pel-15E family pectate lyase
LEKNNYSSHITYNDGVMVGIMGVLDDIIHKKPFYLFVDETHLKKIKTAYDKGLDCILATQIVDNGVLTAWCQQHDEVTLQPAWARKFEPPSICGDESADVVAFLMDIKNPDGRIIKSVNAAIQWMVKSKILYTKVVRVDAPPLVTPFRVSKSDRVVVTDSTAPPIWTRYYELKTNRPLFCNRDSKVVYSLAEVDRERRDGYGWYTYAPQKVLDKYPAWKEKYVK